jgi:CheY-like chemotaxis protein
LPRSGIRQITGAGQRVWKHLSSDRRPPLSVHSDVNTAGIVLVSILLISGMAVAASLQTGLLFSRPVARSVDRELDGMSAAVRIRSLPSHSRHVPIIALTANALVGQRENCLAAGINDFVTKPIQPDTLYRVMDRWTTPVGDAPRDGQSVADGAPAARRQMAPAPAAISAR